VRLFFVNRDLSSTLMATRNLTKKFEGFRQQFKGMNSRKGGQSLSDSLLTESHGSVDPSAVAIAISPTASLPPEWVDIVDLIQKDIGRIKDNIRVLQNMHQARLKVSFGDDEAEKDHEIDILTQEITRLLKNCESGLKRIATIGNPAGGSLPQQERTVRLNVMRALATELQSLSKGFRMAQKDFLLRLRGQEEMGQEFFAGEDGDSKKPLSFDEALERGFTEAELAQLQEVEQTATEREKEIIRIAQSINDLAAIFKELSVLVIEQGTVLDRIDYNVEQTLVKVNLAVGDLVQADKYSAQARTCKCIIALTIVVIILTIILIWKHSSSSSSS